MRAHRKCSAETFHGSRREPQSGFSPSCMKSVLLLLAPLTYDTDANRGYGTITVTLGLKQGIKRNGSVLNHFGLFSGHAAGQQGEDLTG